jgi:peptidoglycan/LPS O-acetylase OafA/YrhL
MANPPASARSPVLGFAIVGVFALVAALLFAAIFLSLPGNQHFYALVTIGILSLVFALGAYLSQALAPDPTMPRALSWGFAGLGFALLVGTILTNPANTLNFIAQLVTLIVVLLFVAVTLLGAYWRSRTVESARARLEQRDAWRSQTPRSALDYSAAQHEREVTQNPPAAPKGQP